MAALGLLALLRLSLIAASRAALRCFSLRWLLLFLSTGSKHTGFSSGGVRDPKSWCTSLVTLCGIFLGQGSNLSPALAGGFFYTVAPGKSLSFSFFLFFATLCLQDLSSLTRGLNLHPLQCKDNVLTIGPPGKSSRHHIFVRHFEYGNVWIFPTSPNQAMDVLSPLLSL